MRVYLLGLGRELDIVLNFLRNTRKYEVVGILSDRRQVITSIDGVPILFTGEADIDDVEAVISVKRNQIDNCMRGGDKWRRKIIGWHCLFIPGFDLESYLEIRGMQWCFVSEDCYGGLLYRYLGMRFTSPFINTCIENEDYYRMLKDLRSRLMTEPQLLKEENMDSYALMGIGDDVKVQLFHYRNGEHGISKWIERARRIRKDSPVLIKKTILDDEDAERFAALPYEHKLGFYYKETGATGIVCLHGWKDAEIRYRYNWDFKKYVRESVGGAGFCQYDILAFLSREKDCENRVE